MHLISENAAWCLEFQKDVLGLNEAGPTMQIEQVDLLTEKYSRIQPRVPVQKQAEQAETKTQLNWPCSRSNLQAVAR